MAAQIIEQDNVKRPPWIGGAPRTCLPEVVYPGDPQQGPVTAKYPSTPLGSTTLGRPISLPIRTCGIMKAGGVCFKTGRTGNGKDNQARDGHSGVHYKLA